MTCKGLHCPGCGDGGGWGVLAAAAAVVIIGAAIARPLEHAADVLLHILLIAAVAVAGLAAAAGAACLAWRTRRSRARSTTPAAFLTPAQIRAAQARTAPRELGHAQQLHLHFHGTDPAQVAAIIQRHNIEED